MNRRFFLALLITAPALAQEPVAEPEIGLQTRHWLELQRSGRQASPVQDRLAPAAADRVSKRMHDSFSHPIPEHFVDREFGDD